MTVASTDSACKAILVSEGSAASLTDCVARVALRKRALSLPIPPKAGHDFPSFVELWGEPSELRLTIETWPFAARAWLVRESVPIAYTRTWPSGKASPGVRFLSTVHRLVGLSHVAFEEHWRGPHTQVAKSYTVPVWNYVQDVVVEAFDDLSEEDGFVGMHFRTADEMKRRWQAFPEEASRGAEDAAKFMDVDRSISIVAVETVWDEMKP